MHRLRHLPPVHFALYPFTLSTVLGHVAALSAPGWLRSVAWVGAFVFLAVAAMVAVGLLPIWKLLTAPTCGCGRHLLDSDVVLARVTLLAADASQRMFDIFRDPLGNYRSPMRRGDLVTGYEASRAALVTICLYVAEAQGTCAACWLHDEYDGEFPPRECEFPFFSEEDRHRLLDGRFPKIP
jgi:hypothetical protein